VLQLVPYAYMPSPIPRQVRWKLVRSYDSIVFGLPTNRGRVGSCIVGFGACSAFTHVTACMLAKSPSDSLHQRLQQSRCLPCCWVERTSSRAGMPPLWTNAFHGAPGYANEPELSTNVEAKNPPVLRFPRELALSHRQQVCGATA